jgi:MtN3 and saliva related transmembrane protein
VQGIAMINPDFFAYGATILNIVMLFPQVIATWKSKETKDLSMATLIMFLSACALWTLYGFSKSALPVIFANVTLGGLNGFLIYLKLAYPTKK